MRAMFVIVSLSLLASIAHAQGGAPKPGETAAPAETPEYDRPVLARSYANGFGRRLANTILLLIDQRTVLRNLPLLGYGLGNVRNACESGPAPGPMIDGEVALVHEASEEGRYFGPKFDFPASKVRWETVCGWLNDPGEIFERSGLYVFDIMGRKGVWREFANEKAQPEGWLPFVEGGIQRGPFGARGDFVRWTVDPDNEEAADRWMLEWTAPREDPDARRQAVSDSTRWWQYWQYETGPLPMAAAASKGGSAAGSFAASTSSVLSTVTVDSLIALGGYSFPSATRYYMSYSAPEYSARESGFRYGMISTCGIGVAGEAPCSMSWPRAPVPDPGEGSGAPAFSLWYDVGEHDADRQAEIDSNWYLLTGEPLLAGSADMWVERSAFR